MVSHQGHCWSLMTPWFSALFRPLNSGARDDQGILAKSGTEDRQKTKKKVREKGGKKAIREHMWWQSWGRGTLPISDPIPDWHLRRGRGEPLGRKVQPIIQSNQTYQHKTWSQCRLWTGPSGRRDVLLSTSGTSAHLIQGHLAKPNSQAQGWPTAYHISDAQSGSKPMGHSSWALLERGGNSLKSDFKSCIIVTSASH